MSKKYFGYCMSAIFIIAAFIVGVSCTTDKQIYRIGVIGPLTGEGATYGTAMKQGIEMAIEETNSKGGVKGTHLQAVYEDDKLLPKEGVSAFRNIVTRYNVPVIIGSAASRVTVAIAPIAEEQKVVLISPISTADELKDAGDYIFRNVPPNHMQGKSAAQFVLQSLKKKQIAILYKNDDYGSNLASSFRNNIKDKGASIVFDEPYDVNQKEFRNVLSKLKQANPEVVFFPGNYQDNGIILRQAREFGITVPFVGGDGAFSTELINLAGPAAENSYYTMLAIPRDPKINAFVAKFKQKYTTEEEPNVFALYAYDALLIVAKAIESGGYASDGIKNALYSIEYEGITGVTRFDSYGEVDKAYSLYTVANGKFELLDWKPE